MKISVKFLCFLGVYSMNSFYIWNRKQNDLHDIFVRKLCRKYLQEKQWSETRIWKKIQERCVFLTQTSVKIGKMNNGIYFHKNAWSTQRIAISFLLFSVWKQIPSAWKISLKAGFCSLRNETVPKTKGIKIQWLLDKPYRCTHFGRGFIGWKILLLRSVLRIISNFPLFSRNALKAFHIIFYIFHSLYFEIPQRSDNWLKILAKANVPRSIGNQRIRPDFRN